MKYLREEMLEDIENYGVTFNTLLWLFFFSFLIILTLLDLFGYKLEDKKMGIGLSFTAMLSQNHSLHNPYIVAMIARSHAIPRSNHDSLQKK